MHKAVYHTFARACVQEFVTLELMSILGSISSHHNLTKVCVRDKSAAKVRKPAQNAEPLAPACVAKPCQFHLE